MDIHITWISIFHIYILLPISISDLLVAEKNSCILHDSVPYKMEC